MSRIVDFLLLAGPMVVSRAGIAGMSIADGIMVARAGPSQLALLGLSEGTLGRLLDVLIAMLLGGIVLAARAKASERPQDAGAVWRRAMAMAVATGLIGTAAGLAAPWWLGWLGESPALASGAAPVAAMLGAGIPLALVAMGTAVFLEAVGRAPAVAVAVVAANLLNIALNWVCIDGKFGLPAMGAFGSELSTTLVRAALAGGFVVYAWTLSDHAHLGIRASGAGAPPGGGALQRRLGYGAAATAAVLNVLGMSLTIFAGWLGALPLATMSALFNSLSIGALFAVGIADATALRVAAAVGGRSDGGASSGPWSAGALGMSTTLVALLALTIPILISPGLLAGLYAPTGPLREALIVLLPLGVLVLLCDGAAFVLGATLRGLGDVVWPMGIQIFVAATLAPLAGWLAIARGGGAQGLVQAILITSVMRAAFLATRLRARSGAAAPSPRLAATQI